jgi:ABC-2 type transport system permease protein
MNGFRAFFKKELMEAMRTHKLTVLGLVFLLFGIMNPLVAKLMPDIVARFLPEGITMTIPTPTALDSWAQFFKNVAQMGLIVLVILFSGMMAGEFSRGTLIQPLTKGLSRRAVIAAKSLSAYLLWTAAYLLCVLVTWAYTVYFWPGDAYANLPMALAGLWAFGTLLLSALLLGGVVWKSGYGCLLLVGLMVVLMGVLNVIPAVKAYNPILLASAGMELLTGTRAASDYLAPLLVLTGLCAAFLFGAALLFDRKAV